MSAQPRAILDRPVGPEVRKTIQSRIESGFFTKFMSGPNVLDIGFRGSNPLNQPIVPHAIGVDRDFPGYDGKTLPFSDQSQDAVHSSHCLEHIPDPSHALADWFRVLRIGGYLILTVPHQQLYERKPTPTSRWGGNEHHRFYTPAVLLAEIEAALPVGEFRVRSLRDNDKDFDYSRTPDQSPLGCYEIEIVLERIARPAYAENLRLSAKARAAIDLYRQTVETLLHFDNTGIAIDVAPLEAFGRIFPIPPFKVLRPLFPAASDGQLRKLLWPLVDPSVVDVKYYVERHPDVRRVVGAETDQAPAHYRRAGYFEGKNPSNRMGLYG
jgi:SAM-dependent methyltransferase